MRAVIVLFLCFVAFAYCQDDNTCVLGLFAPQPFPDMDACCWYESSSCCDQETVEDIVTQQNFMYGNLTNSGENTSQDIIECMTYLEDLLCMLCAPEAYISIDNTQKITVTLCKDYCDSFYAACEKIPEFKVDLNTLDITDGTLLCEGLADIDTGLAKSATPTASTPHFDRIRMKKAGGTEPDFNVIVADKNCYEGESSDVIGVAECTPWDGDYNPNEQSPAADSPGSPADSPGSPNDSSNDGGDDDGESWYYWLILPAGVVVLFAIVICAAIVVIAVVLKRRKSAYSATTTDYPQLDELED